MMCVRTLRRVSDGMQRDRLALARDAMLPNGEGRVQRIALAWY